ncbi:hypothetical protein BT67DRAFT_445194 [Trichocladium antarcticum]|uniref:Uncharacterized protein n=1 Tax=Trichocladium antarcticum TaxID=1450529 RepID=A0AAN6UDB4_9PEZI|nr:hypothetical protein BT67DRAFT_445194 [Trichocladium antarcticum]
MSGGYSLFRCKYFLSHQCLRWVYANGHACAMCLAEGRDAAEPSPTPDSSDPWQPQHQQPPNDPPSPPTEICVPYAWHGTLRYTVMEIIPADGPPFAFPVSGNSDSSRNSDGEGGGGGAGTYWVRRQRAIDPWAVSLDAGATSDTPRPVMGGKGGD